ncbi:ATP-binding protein [Sunxiuqinia indica]|uniref:ATP-binding protein n=1 Tax=Sunxiuqinia indica TaxID=2692584 RepID=UPI0013588451|nr:tetratricopeptide repeat-containing sensor histidine kinase [Sunxiuqinia indica]
MRHILLLVILLTGLLHNAQSEKSKIDSLEALVPQFEGAELVDVYLTLAEEYMYIVPVKSIEYGERSLVILGDSIQNDQSCYANLLIGTGYIFTGEFQKGRKHLTPGLELARTLNNQKYISIGLSSLAAYHMNTGDYEEALSLFKQSLQVATEADLPGWKARAKFNIGSILTNKGDRAGGLKNMIEALLYFESTDNVSIAARILNNIAVNYHAWKEYDLALEYYRKTLRKHELSGDILGKVVVLNNIAEIYKDKSQYKMAFKYYNQIFELAKTNEISEFYLAVGKVGYAETYSKIEKLDSARRYANESLKVFQSAEMEEGVINAKLILGYVDMKEGNLRKARTHAEYCIEKSVQVGLRELSLKAYLLQAQILERMNLYAESLKNYKSYVAISDSLSKENQAHQLALHRAELDIADKENEIELLQKNNEIKDLQLIKQKSQARTLIVAIALLVIVIALSLVYNGSRKKANLLLQQKNDQILSQHEELIRVNQTKDRFLSIIGHDLRNPIGAFKDMISQLAEFPDMFTEELRTQILEELRDEAEGTYFLLDNLLLWAKTQKDSIQFKPEKLKLNLIVKNNIILNTRIAEQKSIDLNSEVSDGVFVFADQNMVDLIIRNLLSNALKFTPKEGKIWVRVQPKDDEFYEVSITDTGVGIKKDDIPRIFDGNDLLSTYGTNNEKGSGLGLILCKEFVEINGGNIQVQSVVDKGSKFSFTLKKYQSLQS